MTLVFRLDIYDLFPSGCKLAINNDDSSSLELLYI